MTAYTIPRANAPISGNDAPTTQWYNFLRFLDTRTSSAAGDVQAQITTIAIKLGSPDGTVDNIPPFGSVTSVQGKQSIVSTGLNIVQLRLVNDADTVPAVSFYGTDSAGVKGWNLLFDAFADTANIVAINTAGIVSFDLTDVTVTTGGALKKYGFDAKGRLSEQDNATTDDLTEGTTNLYNRGSINYAINGAFDVWQRGTSFTSSGVQRDADCWETYTIGSSIVTSRQLANADLPHAARYFCRDVVTAGVASSDLAQRILRVEDIYQFSDRDVYYALIARSSIDCTIAVDLIQMYGDASGSPMYGIGPIGRSIVNLTAGDWTEIKSAAVSLPLAIPPVFPDPGTSGLQVSLWMNAGSDWDSPGFSIGLNSGTFDWALVSVSDAPIDYRRTLLDDEIRRCQRYLEKSFPLGVAPAQNAGVAGAFYSPQVVAASTASGLGHVAYKASKPRSVTPTLYNPSAANAQPRNVPGASDWSSAAITGTSADGFSVTATSPAGSSVGQSAAFHWFADAYLNPTWNGVTPPPALMLTGNAPDGTIGVPYSYGYTASGGALPYVFSIVSGALPTGITLNTSTGVISGTPTTNGSYSWTIRVTDALANFVDLPDSNTIAYATLTLTGTYPGATVGVPYSQTLAIAGGLSPYSLTGGTGVSSGSLPAGLALSVVGSTLVLSGTPTTAATATFTASVDSTDGQTATSPQSIVVSASTNVVSLLHFDGTNGSTTITDAYGKTWTASGAAALSTAEAKFGPSSLLVGSAGYVSANIGTFGAGDFTYEGWIYPTSSGTRGIFDLATIPGGPSSAAGLALGYNGGNFQIYHNSSVDTTGAYTLALNTWTAWCLERVGTTITLYMNGVSIYSFTESYDFTAYQVMTVGLYYSTAFPTIGYIDEFRATHGAYQYGGNYTPATAPFT